MDGEAFGDDLESAFAPFAGEDGAFLSCGVVPPVEVPLRMSPVKSATWGKTSTKDAAISPTTTQTRKDIIQIESEVEVDTKSPL
jgi:hypothetical protein